MFEFNEVTEENKIKKHFSCQRHIKITKEVYTFLKQ